MKYLKAFLCCTVLAALPGPRLLADDASARQLDRAFTRSTLKIATPDARLHKFKIWVADDAARRARGLMFVEHLEEDSGMLFVYPQVQPVSMWMKNTHIALDMLFVGPDGRVEHVVENTKPMSLDTIESKATVRGVIELKGGVAARLKIRPGARVIHPVFETP
ncbi:MAG: DUF192 domain-containing protein [Steroidobacteraceae bacterium]